MLYRHYTTNILDMIEIIKGIIYPFEVCFQGILIITGFNPWVGIETSKALAKVFDSSQDMVF